MKFALTSLVALALTLVAVPALAEDLGGSSDFAACTVSPESVRHVKRDATKARWVRVKATVHCEEQYSHGKVTLRIAGINSQGVVASPRDVADRVLRRPVEAGDHKVKATLRCNVKENGEWTYSPLNLQIWIFAQVYRSGTWYRTTVSDQTKSLTC